MCHRKRKSLQQNSSSSSVHLNAQTATCLMLVEYTQLPCALARRDLAKQYEKKLEQLKREEELIREEQREMADTLPSDDPAAAKGLVRACG